MLAIVEIAGKQYKVAPGDTVRVDRVDGSVGNTLAFDRVLLLSDNGKASVGKPYLKGALVKAKVLSQGKGEKIHIRRFKSKVRERRHIGFRPQETTLSIVSVGKA